MKTIYKIIILVPVLSSLIISCVFIGIGVYETFLGIKGVFTGLVHTDATPGVNLFEALDIFLIGFLFLIFAIGFSQLFMPKQSKFMETIEIITPDWLKVQNFTQLKLILWDTVLTSLVVKFVGDAYRLHGKYDWELAIIPITILLISLSRFLLKKVNH